MSGPNLLAHLRLFPTGCGAFASGRVDDFDHPRRQRTIDSDRLRCMVASAGPRLGDAWRLRFFAEATGQLDPVYTDVTVAMAAGHPALPLPPTFLACLAFT